MAGVAGALVIHPVDSLRVIAQRNISFSLGQSCKQLAKTGFAAGLAPALTTQASIYSLLFGVQESLHSIVARETSSSGTRTVFTSALAGSLTGIVIAPITTPLEVLKCRQQAGKVLTPSTPSILFRGLGATMARCGLGNAAFFACIHTMSSHPLYTDNDGSSSSWRDAVIGATSGIVYWLFAAPFDIIKSRQQTNPSSSPALSFVAEARQIMLERGGPGGGILAFWRGFGLAVARTIPMQAVVMLSYTSCLRALYTTD